MRRFVSIVTLIPLFALTLTACAEQGAASGIYGGGEEEAPAAAGGEAEQDEAGQAEVVMQSTTFQPQQLTVQPGTTVTWTNEDGFAHTVTSGTRDDPTAQFDSGEIDSGGTFSFTFEEAGSYDYFCTLHPGMSGQVVVEE